MHKHTTLECHVHAGNFGNGQNILNPCRGMPPTRVVVVLVFFIATAGRRHGHGRGTRTRQGRRQGSRNASMNTKDILINHGGQGQTIKGLIANFPDSIANVIAKAGPTLIHETPIAIMFFPSIDIPRFVIAPQQVEFGRILQFQGKQIGQTFQTLLAPIDIVTQKQKVARRQTQAETPQIVTKKVQIFQIAMNVAKDIGGRLQKDDARFRFQQVAHADGNFVQILGKLLRIQVIQMLRRTLKHVNNALNRRRILRRQGRRSRRSVSTSGIVLEG